MQGAASCTFIVDGATVSGCASVPVVQGRSDCGWFPGGEGDIPVTAECSDSDNNPVTRVKAVPVLLPTVELGVDSLNQLDPFSIPVGDDVTILVTVEVFMRNYYISNAQVTLTFIPSDTNGGAVAVTTANVTTGEDGFVAFTTRATAEGFVSVFPTLLTTPPNIVDPLGGATGFTVTPPVMALVAAPALLPVSHLCVVQTMWQPSSPATWSTSAGRVKVANMVVSQTAF